eukprot:TRINITY_DN11009_c0_g1_i1.p1 TRINITY_DN11009_c0_g1~~TRINITY_DN11009_c0_g1_i1.p1  ORF type:complete len:127 (+),score=21.92 TRINITY_DN11009_c0_g1_i1:94-474(+)
MFHSKMKHQSKRFTNKLLKKFQKRNQVLQLNKMRLLNKTKIQRSSLFFLPSLTPFLSLTNLRLGLDILEKKVLEYKIKFVGDQHEENNMIFQLLSVPGDITFAEMSQFKKSLASSFEDVDYNLKKN